MMDGGTLILGDLSGWFWGRSDGEGGVGREGSPNLGDCLDRSMTGDRMVGRVCW